MTPGGRQRAKGSAPVQSAGPGQAGGPVPSDSVTAAVLGTARRRHAPPATRHLSGRAVAARGPPLLARRSLCAFVSFLAEEGVLLSGFDC